MGADAEACGGEGGRAGSLNVVVVVVTVRWFSIRRRSSNENALLETTSSISVVFFGGIIDCVEEWNEVSVAGRTEQNHLF